MMSARVIQAIETDMEMRGTGTVGDPFRRITQYWSLDGVLLAEKDPMAIQLPPGASQPVVVTESVTQPVEQPK